MGANSASLVQRRVAKLDPVQWQGVPPGPISPGPVPSSSAPTAAASSVPHSSASSAPASPSHTLPEPAPEEPPSATVPAQDSVPEAVPTTLAEAEEEDALTETVPMNPLGCFEPALADEAEGEPEIDEEVSVLDISKKLQGPKYET